MTQPFPQREPFARVWLWFTSTLLAVACAPEHPTAPNHSPEALSPAATESGTLKGGKHPRVGVRCVVAGADSGGAPRSAVISPSEIENLLGAGSSELAADTMHATLRFEVTSIPGSSAIIGCLVPYGRAASSVRERIASGVRKNPSRLSALLVEGQQRGEADAPREAWRALRAHYLPSEPTHARTAHSTGRAPHMTPASEGYDTAGTPPPTDLPTIQVVATQGQWWIFPQHLFDGARRTFGFSDLINWEWYFYDGPDCAEASALWFAQEEEANILEQHAALVEPQIAALTSALCDTTVSPLPWCIDVHIQRLEHSSFKAMIATTILTRVGVVPVYSSTSTPMPARSGGT